jgi:DNA polymerase-3 subunit epsilon
VRLDRPICIIDTETTGVEVESDRIVQIATVRLETDGTTTMSSHLVNAGVPIPPEATAIHGIDDLRVANEQPFPDVWPLLRERMLGAVLCAYNARFDVGILAAECKRHRISWQPPERVIDPLVIFRTEAPHTLEGAVRYYLGLNHEHAHDALYDCMATRRVLLEQIQRAQYDAIEDLLLASQPAPDPRWVDSERKFYWRFHEPVFAFGKHRGRALRDVARTDGDYLGWLLRQEIAPDVRRILQDAGKGKIARKEPAGVAS